MVYKPEMHTVMLNLLNGRAEHPGILLSGAEYPRFSCILHIFLKTSFIFALSYFRAQVQANQEFMMIFKQDSSSKPLPSSL